MTRLAKIQGDGQGGTYDALMGGINNGLGIAGAMRQRDIDKMQMAGMQRETEEWDKNTDVREATRKANFQAQTTKYTEEVVKGLNATDLEKTTIGTNLSNTAAFLTKNEGGMTLDEINSRLPQMLNDATGGKISYSAAPIKLEDGTTAYEATFSGGGQSKKYVYKSAAELGTFINTERMNNNMPTIGERIAHRQMAGEAKLLWDQLNTDDRKLLGLEEWDQNKALANREFMSVANSALEKDITGPEMMKFYRDNKYLAEDQEMDKSNFELNQRATKLNMANTSQLMTQRKSEHDYNVSQRPLNTLYNQLKADSAALEKDDKVMDILSTTYPQFSPSVPILDESGADTGKRSFDPNQINDMRVVTQMARGYGPEVHPADALFKATERLSKMRLDEAAALADADAKKKAEEDKLKGAKLGVGKDAPGQTAKVETKSDRPTTLVDAEAADAKADAEYKADAPAREDEARYIREREAEKQRLYQQKYVNTQGYGVGWKRQ